MRRHFLRKPSISTAVSFVQYSIANITIHYGLQKENKHTMSNTEGTEQAKKSVYQIARSWGGASSIIQLTICSFERDAKFY